MSMWTDCPTPTSTRYHKSSSTISSKFNLDSPPEAAVEATPDNTPYTTPVKVHSLISNLPSRIKLSLGTNFCILLLILNICESI